MVPSICRTLHSGSNEVTRDGDVCRRKCSKYLTSVARAPHLISLTSSVVTVAFASLGLVLN